MPDKTFLFFLQSSSKRYLEIKYIIERGLQNMKHADIIWFLSIRK